MSQEESHNPEHLRIVERGTQAIFDWALRNAGCNLSLRHARIAKADLSDAILRGADLRHADLRGTVLDGASLSGSFLEGANLGSSSLHHADLSSASLRRAHLAHAKIGQASFEGADLRSANLEGVDLGRANLRGANLAHAHLDRANLWSADLTGANLRGASLKGVNLNRTKLSDSDLTDAKLQVAYMLDTKMIGARLRGAIFERVSAGSVDLSETSGLAEVVHHGPSSIGIDTLVKSAGAIPAEFLRGCGLQDWEVEQAKLYEPDLTPHQISDIQYRVHELLADPPILVTPMFISYSHGDTAFVDQMEQRLNDKKIRFWRDIHDLEAGKVDKQIKRTFESLEPVVLMILSERSVKSDWVEWEATEARELEKRIGRDVLCPIALDDAWKTADWSGPLRAQIKKYNVLDFSDWENQSKFDTAFGKLFRGLEHNYNQKPQEGDAKEG